MYYNKKFDTKQLNTDFLTYDSISDSLFDKNLMYCTASNFVKYIQKINYVKSSKTSIRITKSTYYERINKINKDYPAYISSLNLYSENSLSLIEQIYYFRLTKCFEKCICDDSAEFFLNRFKVTNNFYPLYIALIYSASDNKNWEYMVNNTNSLSENIVKISNNSENRFVSLSSQTAINYYKYWTKLFFPTKLCKLITDIEKIKQEDINPLIKRALEWNLSLFLDQIKKSIFKSIYIQDIFLSHAARLFKDFEEQRTHGFKNVTPNAQNFISKGQIGENLNIDFEYCKNLEEREYSKYLATKQGSGNPLI